MGSEPNATYFISMNESTSMTRVLVAEDHPSIRSVLKRIFQYAGDIKVVGEAGNAREVFQQVKTCNADVLLLDINMPGKDGLEILRELHDTKKDVPVVILTLFPQERLRSEAMRLGAVDFLSKDCQPDELIDAVRKAAAA